jgi:hypothetical protein
MSESPIQLTMYEGSVARFQLGAHPTPAHFKTHFTDAVENMFEADRKFSLIIDSSQVNAISLEITGTMVKWLKTNRERLGKHLVSSSVIVTSNLVKNVFDMVFRFYSPIAPLKIVQCEREAWDFVEANEV